MCTTRYNARRAACLLDRSIDPRLSGFVMSIGPSSIPSTLPTHPPQGLPACWRCDPLRRRKAMARRRPGRLARLLPLLLLVLLLLAALAPLAVEGFHPSFSISRRNQQSSSRCQVEVRRPVTPSSSSSIAEVRCILHLALKPQFQLLLINQINATIPPPSPRSRPANQQLSQPRNQSPHALPPHRRPDRNKRTGGGSAASRRSWPARQPWGPTASPSRTPAWRWCAAPASRRRRCARR